MWAKLNHTGDEPSARSGHSMTTVGNSYVMFGGIDVPNDAKKDLKKAVPNDDVYIIRIGLSKLIHTSRRFKDFLNFDIILNFILV